jgi:cob(I)alamin adenosyltransferase
MKIYTKTGDDGQTGLFGGARVQKDDARIDAYGELDELNAVLGRVRQHRFGDAHDALLAELQSRLFDLGAELANASGKPMAIHAVDDADVERLEQAIDGAETELAPLRTFVLPGGSPLAAELHVARTVCRRAERRIVTLAALAEVRSEVLRYVNRMSDLLFVLARLANHRAGVADVPWVGRGTQKT